MAEEQFRLRASIDDQLSAPLMKLRQHLGNIRPTPEMKAVRAELDALQRTVERINKAGGPTNDVLGGFGFNLSAAAGIAAVANSMRNLAQQTVELRHVSRETGLAANELRALQKTGERFQIAPEAVTQNMQSFADKMNLLRRGLGETAGVTRELAPGLFGQLKGSKDNLEALDKALSFLGKIKDPIDQKRWADQLGLGNMTRMFTDGPEAFGKAWREARSKVGKDGDFSAQAKQMLDATREMNAQWERLEKLAAPPVFQAVADILKTTNEEIEGIKRVWDALGDKWDSVFGTGRKPPPAPTGNKVADVEAQLKDAKERKDWNEKNYAKSDPRYEPRQRELTDQIERLTEELKKLREAGGGATVSPSSFGGGTGLGGLIHTAGWGGITAPMYRRMAEAYNASPQGRTQRAIAGMGATIEGGAPRGSGSGDARAARVGQMMGYAMDQLRREGVPEEHLRRAAAHLVGQATMESGLDPNKSHDGGTGYGIYGARDPSPGRGRRTSMLNWLKANGYAPNSAEGQMRYMAREAMGGDYPKTQSILMGRSSGSLDADTNTITGEFEAPKIINRRSGAVSSALRIGPDGADAPSSGFRASPGWRASDHPGVPHGSMLAPGDDGMLARARRAGLAGGSTRIDGSIGATVTFRNPPPGMSVKTKTSGIVEERKVDRGATLGDFGSGMRSNVA